MVNGVSAGSPSVAVEAKPTPRETELIAIVKALEAENARLREKLNSPIYIT